jgi:hypothetical protein
MKDSAVRPDVDATLYREGDRGLQLDEGAESAGERGGGLKMKRKK